MAMMDVESHVRQQIFADPEQENFVCAVGQSALKQYLHGSLTVVNRRRGRKGLCGLIFFVKFEKNACSMG